MAYLNEFAPGIEPIDLSGTDEFKSLLQSAGDLGLNVSPNVQYRARNVVVNGLRFHTLEWGDPSSPPVLLLHGGNQTGHSWDLVSLALAPRYHVIAYDQRGHGDSEWPRDSDASIPSMADDARQMIGYLELRNPIVMGHSMGGMVTMRLLVNNPGIARKAVLVDVGPEVAAEGAQMIGDFVRTAQEFDSLEDFIERVAAYDPYRSREHIGRTARYNLLQRATDGKFVSKHDHRRRVAATAEQPTTVQIPRAPSWDEVATIQCPVLLLRGEQSNVLTPESAERFAKTMPQGRLVTVPKCGHNVHSQNTPGFLDAVLPFVQEA